MSINAIILSLLPLITCDRKMDSFVVDGLHVKIERQPHSAFMGTSCLVNGAVSNWRCGASIITQNIILTAAHCFDSCRKGIIRGTVFRTGHENKNLGEMSSGYKYVMHTSYRTDISGYDIALVLLKTELTLSAKCSRVALMKHPPYDEIAYVAGWGLVNEKKRIGTNYLKEARQTIMNRKACSRIIRNIPVGTICSGNDYDGFASEGDSGSALVVRGYIQVGLVSSKVLHKSDSITLYTDIGYYYDWIVQKAMTLNCNNTNK